MRRGNVAALAVALALAPIEASGSAAQDVPRALQSTPRQQGLMSDRLSRTENLLWRAWEAERRASRLVGQVGQTPSGRVSQGEAMPDLTMQASSESLGEMARQTRRSAERIHAAFEEPGTAEEEAFLRDLDRMTTRLGRVVNALESSLLTLERRQDRVTARLGR